MTVAAFLPRQLLCGENRGSLVGEWRGAFAVVQGAPVPPVSHDLEHEGVRAFCDSYRELLACIDAKLADAASHTPVTQPEAAA